MKKMKNRCFYLVKVLFIIGCFISLSACQTNGQKVENETIVLETTAEKNDEKVVSLEEDNQNEKTELMEITTSETLQVSKEEVNELVQGILGDVEEDDLKSSVEEETSTEDELELPSPGEIVRVRDYIPGVQVDLVYGTNRNFTGQVIYSFHDAYLRYSVVEKLKFVQSQLEEEDLSLLIWDGFRPVEAQFVLYDVCPDSTYVADPYNGYSNHSRGNAVDLTIADNNGNPIVMPTGFDDFSSKADRDYSDCSKEERENALLLEELMIEAGFEPYFGEWWHFTENQYYDPVLDVTMEDLEALEK